MFRMFSAALKYCKTLAKKFNGFVFLSHKSSSWLFSLCSMLARCLCCWVSKLLISTKLIFIFTKTRTRNSHRNKFFPRQRPSTRQISSHPTPANSIKIVNWILTTREYLRWARQESRVWCGGGNRRGAECEEIVIKKPLCCRHHRNMYIPNNQRINQHQITHK